MRNTVSHDIAKAELFAIIKKRQDLFNRLTANPLESRDKRDLIWDEWESLGEAEHAAYLKEGKLWVEDAPKDPFRPFWKKLFGK